MRPDQLVIYRPDPLGLSSSPVSYFGIVNPRSKAYLVTQHWLLWWSSTMSMVSTRVSGGCLTSDRYHRLLAKLEEVGLQWVVDEDVGSTLDSFHRQWVCSAATDVGLMLRTSMKTREERDGWLSFKHHRYGHGALLCCSRRVEDGGCWFVMSSKEGWMRKEVVVGLGLMGEEDDSSQA